MAPKKKNRGRGRRSKTPAQTSTSDPNPTATSPSASAPTSDATTASLVPSSASPSAPPTTTTHLILSTPPQTTSLLPFSPSQITVSTQPLPSPQPLPIGETRQERISCTSDGDTTTDHAGPSTAPSASAASTDDFMSLYATAFEEAMAAVRSVKDEEPTPLHELAAILFGLPLDNTESILECLLKLAEQMKGDAQVKAASEALADLRARKSTIRAAKMHLAEGKKRDGSGSSCSGSKGAGGGPDSGRGEGDGEGGGVNV